MRTFRIMLVCFVCVINTCAQNRSDGKVNIDKKRSYYIKNENKIYNSFSGDSSDNELVEAYLIVNNDSLRTIKSARAVLSGDTLLILIHQDDPSYDHKYKIEVFNNKFKIEYHFTTPGGEDETRTITTVKSKLILNSLKLKKGAEIRGYTEFEGLCRGFCWDEVIKIKGNFKAVIE